MRTIWNLKDILLEEDTEEIQQSTLKSTRITEETLTRILQNFAGVKTDNATSLDNDIVKSFNKKTTEKFMIEKFSIKNLWIEILESR